MKYLRKKGEKTEYPRNMDPWEEFVRKYGQLALTYFAPDIENRPKSNKVEVIIPLLKSLSLEVNTKKLPPAYHHWSFSSWQNTKIRVDHIPKSAAACWSIAIRALIGYSRTTKRVLELYFEDKSNFCAFLTFPDHDYATRFVEKFNNKQIPGTDMIYQLSWAPFQRNFSILPEEEEEEEEGKGKEEEGKGKEGNTFMSDAEEFIRKLPVDNNMFSKIYAFHESLKKDVAIESEALSKRGILDTVMHGPDDGRTTTLCLTMVDPCVKESFMKSIFEQYGECNLKLPDKEGCGLVKFVQRTYAENAFSDLATLLKDEKVCCLHWGIDWEERNRRFKKFGLRGFEREGLPAGYISFSNTSLLELFPAAAARSKWSTGAETSKRSIGAEMSNRFQSVRKSVSKTKAIAMADTSKHPTGADTSKRPTVADTSKRLTGADTSKRLQSVRKLVSKTKANRRLPADRIRFAESSSLTLSPLHGENDREEKAIAMAETSKRPTGADTSKRFQSVRKLVSKTKAKRGRTHY